jgi:hypothetical protein
VDKRHALLYRRAKGQNGAIDDLAHGRAEGYGGWTRRTVAEQGGQWQHGADANGTAQAGPCLAVVV